MQETPLDRPLGRPAQASPVIAGPGSDRAPVHDAAALTAGGRLARIRLDGKEYVLRITRAGKLILTK